MTIHDGAGASANQSTVLTDDGKSDPLAAANAVLVVGIGASAGGVEALSRFFDAVPPDSGAAFVIVLHLDPTRESQMAQVLSSHTKMSVVQVADDMAIAPNTVYVIAPDKDLTVSKATLQLIQPAESRGHRHPVDVLFRSLAADQGERAIAIVLSGTGSNGTDGLKEIKAAGGLILVQDPPTAKFDGMPQSAIAAGMADHILAPEAMPEVLLSYISQNYISHPRDGETATSTAQPVIDQILTLLFTRTGNDFRNYRRSTLQRRIQRRLGLKSIATLAAYKDELRSNTDEAPLLVKDLLINVTSFFRDADAWKALANLVIAPMMAGRETGAAIRVWVPGCSTGEEAYTLAILISEQAAILGKKFDVKIFATDAREDNLKTARDGIYPLAAVTGLTSTRQRVFFDKLESSYQVKKDIRSTVVFAPQNLLRDPPFSHLDLVTCRNLLIYLEPETQQSIIALFHFALEEGGNLMLGNTETLGRHEAMFEVISKKWRIFRRAGPTRLDIVNFPVLRGTAKSAQSNDRAGTPLNSGPTIATGEIARRALLEHFAPAAVVIDRNCRVVYFHGSTGNYLEQPTGEPSKDLFLMTRDGLTEKLRTAVRAAIAENKTISVTANVKHNATLSKVVVKVSPLTRDPAHQGYMLVSFVPENVPPQLSDNGGSNNVVADLALQDELKAVRSELQNTIEHLENTNEELKASHEEATSMNEELQSTNEELETSKEEMQSFNEELHTVNSQLQHKVQELEDSANDLSNLLAGTETATLFVDENLCLKWFSPGTLELFNFIRTDIGRPISHFARKFDDENLLPDAEKVLRTLVVLEVEVQAADRRWLMRRMLPYRTLDNHIAGVVITFVDVTEHKRISDASEEARIYAQAIVETIRQPLLVLDDAMKVVSTNPAFQSMSGLSAKNVIDKPVFEIGGGDWGFPKLRELLDLVISKNQGFNDVEIDHEFGTIGYRCMLVNGRRLERGKGRPGLILFAIEDITVRKTAADIGAKFRTLVESSDDMIASIDVEGKFTSWNAGAERIFGYSPHEVLFKSSDVLLCAKQTSITSQIFVQFESGGGNFHIEAERRRKDGTMVWISANISPIRTHAGTIEGASVIARDITERHRAEAHREILVGELNHRVKNTLAVVSAIASQTLAGATSIKSASEAFAARLQALARAHDLLMHGNWSGIDLWSVVRATIDPHDGDERRFKFEGPVVPLQPALAVTFSLALHELCTNATKYGALSVPGGRVEIVWQVQANGNDSRLQLTWTETGGPPVVTPMRKGFGTRLVQRALALELNGQVNVEYPPSGVICTIDAPLPSGHLKVKQFDATWTE